jgi:ATP-binding cassette subfamily F protein 3
VVVYRNLNFEAERGDRTVLVGPNGAGKSTLMKLLAGVLPVRDGIRELGSNVRAGYFSQHRVEMLDLRRTVLESVLDVPEPVPEQTARTVLGSFLFRGDDVFKTVGVLSGGEKSRLALVRLLLYPPNLLLMDEPTTHLDVGSIDALIGALEQYQGTLLFISHDVHFIRAIARSVLRVDAGELTRYAGDYQYYLDKIQATSESAALVAGRSLTNAQPVAGPAEAGEDGVSAVEENRKPGLREQKEQKRAEAEVRKEQAKLRREREKRLHEIEMRIATLEGEQKELVAELENPAAYESGGRATTIHRELTAVTSEIDRLTAEWDQASAALIDA